MSAVLTRRTAIGRATGGRSASDGFDDGRPACGATADGRSAQGRPTDGRHVVLPRRAPRLAPVTRWTIGALGLALVLGAGVLGSRLASDPARFPVSNVDVLGTLDYTDRETLRTGIEAHLARGFYGLDIDAVRHGIEALPWVANARVSRVWPGRLSVEIDEHEPAARWNDGALLSKRLALFRPPQLEPDHARGADWRALFDALPRLSGAEGRHAAVLDDFRRYERELARFDVALEALAEDERRSQTLTLSNGVTVRLGYEERELRLARFVDVYERLVAPLEGRPARFDMRYSNGFALSGAGAATTDITTSVTDSDTTGEGEPG